MGMVPWDEDVEIEWDDENVAHFADHGTEPWAVDEMVDQGEYEVIRHPKWRKSRKHRHRYLVTGRTLGGRGLLVIVDKIGLNRIRPVTGWDI